MTELTETLYNKHYDTELFKLCSEVYKRTEWDTGEDKWYRNEEDDDYSHPLYTSDYLLEKLPPVIFTRTSDGSNLTAILTLWVNGDKTVHAAYMIPFDEQNRGDYAKTADTPLKALLKLVIALHDAKELV